MLRRKVVVVAVRGEISGEMRSLLKLLLGIGELLALEWYSSPIVDLTTTAVVSHQQETRVIIHTGIDYCCTVTPVVVICCTTCTTTAQQHDKLFFEFRPSINITQNL
jgi:hypothetical protein